MDLTKVAIVVLFSVALLSVSAAQTQQQTSNQTVISKGEHVTVPGDALYGLKRVRESLSLAMARAPLIGGPDKEARVLSRNADERLREANALIGRNETERAQKALNRYSETIGKAMDRAEASSNNQTRNEIAEKARANQEVLQRVSRNAPEQAQEGLQNAIESARKARNSFGDAGSRASSKSDTSDNPFVPPDRDQTGTSEGPGQQSSSSGPGQMSSDNGSDEGNTGTSDSPFRAPGSGNP